MLRIAGHAFAGTLLSGTVQGARPLQALSRRLQDPGYGWEAVRQPSAGVPSPFQDHLTAGSSFSTHVSPDQFDASSSLEPLLFILSPSQLGVQAFHSLYTLTSLPWWASIPLTTLAARVALAPLSIRAKAASAHFPLMQTALSKSRAIRHKINEHLVTSGKPAHGPSMWTMTRLTHKYLANQLKVPSFKWYTFNAVVQAGVLSSLTAALKYMCSSLWPGFVTGGTLYFKDLTAPAVYLQTLSTPLGTMGAVMPLSLVLLYISSIDLAAGARVPGIIAALRLSAVPIYCVALLQPHAVLLSWVAAAASHYALQSTFSRPTSVALGGVPADSEAAYEAVVTSDSSPTADSRGLAAAPSQQHDHALERRPKETSSVSATIHSGSEAAEVQERVDMLNCHEGGEHKSSIQLTGGDIVLSANHGDAELLTHLGLHFARSKAQQQQQAIAAACFHLALELKPNCSEASMGLQTLKS